MSHRHYCPDEATCNDRDPCCLFTEGDCLCDYANQCIGAPRPTYAYVPGVGVVEVPAKTPAVRAPRHQPRQKKSRAKRRSSTAR
jgi:hypothetical protein